MEQPRKLLLFFTLTLGFMLFWNAVVMPVFMPPPKPGEENVAEQPADDQEKEKVAAAPEKGDDPDKAAVAESNPDPADPPSDAPITEPEPTQVTIGSPDPDSGYFLNVRLSSRGASIEAIELNDPKFLELDRRGQLKLVGNTPTEYRTFATGVDVIDAELRKQNKTLDQWHWEYVPEQDPAAARSRAVFRTEIAGIEVQKTYSLKKVEGENLRQLRRSELAGYLIDCAITFTNKGASPTSLTYQLQGPVGVKLENEEHARENRKIQISFVGDDDDDDDSIAASTIYDDEVDGDLEVWKTPFRYVGVDNTYFAALIVSDTKTRPIAEIRPMVVEGNRKNPDHSDVSLELTSAPVSLAAGETATHNYQFFAGPKRRELLDQPPLEASKVLNLGITGFIARWMLGLLGFFHNLGLPYGLAIICLTVLVRGCMFPLSRKQALSAQKMKELQPEIQALKEKYGTDKEKMAKAQMELFAKHRYNPFAGCLPLLFQFPIFIGLYTALYHSIDLRLAKFLWIDNLAAPDATFRMPFRLPILGQDFSILPILTVALFLIQQKMFMPPPANEEQAMQHKMMNFMTIAFGFFFWHSPSGLCLYFIASSLWGITERKLLARVSQSTEPAAETQETRQKAAPQSVSPRENEKNGDKKPGFLERKIRELAEAAAAANDTNTQTRNISGDRRGKKKKKRR